MAQTAPLGAVWALWVSMLLAFKLSSGIAATGYLRGEPTTMTIATGVLKYPLLAFVEAVQQRGR